MIYARLQSTTNDVKFHNATYWYAQNLLDFRVHQFMPKYIYRIIIIMLILSLIMKSRTKIESEHSSRNKSESPEGGSKIPEG